MSMPSVVTLSPLAMATYHLCEIWLLGCDTLYLFPADTSIVPFACFSGTSLSLPYVGR
jgi:hypothetical protein